MSSDTIREEFRRVCQADAVDMEEAFPTSINNRKLNRWGDVFSNEHTMFPQPPGPYLNANLFLKESFDNAPHDLVGCQAPLPSQFGDFYETIATHSVPLVLMLTQEKENGVRKAHAYWPSKVNSDVNLMNGCTVRMLKVEENRSNETIRRTMRVTFPDAANSTNNNNNNTTKTHEFMLIQFLGWPDFGIPKNPSAFLDIVKTMRQTTTQKGPVIAHCSAGIGRTGTLFGVYYGMHIRDQGTKLTPPTVSDLVVRLKRVRTGMVQRPEQLAFIYACLGVS